MASIPHETCEINLILETAWNWWIIVNPSPMFFSRLALQLVTRLHWDSWADCWQVFLQRESKCTSAASSGPMRTLSSKARRNATPLPPMKFGSGNSKRWNPYAIIWMVNQTVEWTHVWKRQRSGKSQKNSFQNWVVGQQSANMTMLWFASIPETGRNCQLSRLAGS